ncbi:hypothetical protein [Vallitalea guaymasensis]|uniref:hypothetical protein n=1 Tax=Vallitalea guaymasensis TaxID=1185412 RepID=UPI000DE1AEA5|nr:hypothetical protein [Vallitalea guaymasensis]
MSRLTIFIISGVFISIIIVTSALSMGNKVFRENLKENIVLSSKVLKNNISLSEKSMDSISKGYKRKEKDIIIDEEKLLYDFNQMLYRHYLNEKNYLEVKNKLYVKALVYPEYFILANVNDKWSAPYYFTYVTSDDKLIYLNTVDNNAYYFDNADNRVDTTLDAFSLTTEEKQDIILNKLNLYVSLYTKLTESDKGLVINIKNQFKEDNKYLLDMQNFNPLENVTFFTVYVNNKKITLWNYLLKLNTHEVVGYTIS